MAAAYVSNLTINAGATFSQTFNLANTSDGSPLNLNSYTVKSQLRKHPASSTWYDFVATIDDSSQGKFTLTMESSTTSILDPGRYLYDVLIKDSGTQEVTRVVEGNVLVRGGITE